MISTFSRRVLAALVVGAALFALDRFLEADDPKHADLSGLREQAKRLGTKKNARIVTVGQSTIGQWLTPEVLGSIRDVNSKYVLDGHMSACFPNCNWSVVRNLLAQKRHFKEAYFGINEFEMCEGTPSHRIMQSIELTPGADTVPLLRHLGESASPSTFLGTWAGMMVSHAYRDVTYVQDNAANALFGKSRPEQWQRAESVDALGRPDTPAKKKKAKERDRSCTYSDKRIRMQLSFLKSTLVDLGKLADRTFLLVLPDRTLAKTTDQPELAHRWDLHMRTLADVASAYPHVTLIDLVTDGAATPDMYRDGFHLNSKGATHQTKLLKRRLAQAR